MQDLLRAKYQAQGIDERFVKNLLILRFLSKPLRVKVLKSLGLALTDEQDLEENQSPTLKVTLSSIWRIGLGAEGFLEELLGIPSGLSIPRELKVLYGQDRTKPRHFGFIVPQEYLRHLIPGVYAGTSLPKLVASKGREAVKSNVSENKIPKSSLPTFNLDPDVEDFPSEVKLKSVDSKDFLDHWDKVEEKESESSHGEVGSVCKTYESDLESLRAQHLVPSAGESWVEEEYNLKPSKESMVELSDLALGALALWPEITIRLSIMCQDHMQPLTDKEIKVISGIIGTAATLRIRG
jgi:hypothetical protein